MTFSWYFQSYHVIWFLRKQGIPATIPCYYTLSDNSRVFSFPSHRCKYTLGRNKKCISFDTSNLPKAAERPILSNGYKSWLSIHSTNSACSLQESQKSTDHNNHHESCLTKGMSPTGRISGHGWWTLLEYTRIYDKVVSLFCFTVLPPTTQEKKKWARCLQKWCVLVKIPETAQMTMKKGNS